jgi:hypothetical protein
MPAPPRATVLEPIARGALRGDDFALRHLVGDFPPQPNGVAIALHGREIEPFVRGDEIDRHFAAKRVHHAKFEQHVACGRSFTERRRRAVENLKTCHPKIPCPCPVAISAIALLPA